MEHSHNVSPYFFTPLERQHIFLDFNNLSPMRTPIIILCFLIQSIVTYAQPAISPCAQLTDLHIVVIGSSTAAGTGPTVPDSAWVNRYRAYLQSINPQNQVTNLAIGGTTTYHIMPNSFVAPNGKPATNPNNNISQAISLGASGIIVNMPSNDAANGFGINEQMSNFITLKNAADNANIPIWFCTTQPRNGFNTATRAIQTGVRDSILNYFGSNAIDFWTGFADGNNNMLAAFDSGDGVHLNDAAHNSLNQRVIQKAIPNHLADTLAMTDHLLVDLSIDNNSICGDSNTIVTAVVGNIGSTSTQTLDVFFELTDLQTATTSTQTLSATSPLQACAIDTFSISINSYNGVQLNFQAYINNLDNNSSNDSSQTLLLQTSGHPNLTNLEHDTACLGDSSLIYAYSNVASDSILWYDAPTNGNLVGLGDSLLIPNLQQNQVFYPQAVRGDLSFKQSLFTSSTTTTNFNGIMFDIVASENITIDSLTTKIQSTGMQNVVAYYRTSSHVGHENNSNAWTYWGLATVQVPSAGSFPVLNLPAIYLANNDTLGIYLHMQNGGANLSYLASSTGLEYHNNEVKVLSGSGITHTFGTTYTPRNWSGTVFYHYGFNPTGDCTSPRLPVHAVVSTPSLNLGNDTTLFYDQSITLNPGNFNHYQWSNNSNQTQLLVDSSNFNLGMNTIWLTATDAYGCMVSDTIVVTFTINTGLLSLTTQNTTVYPNPTQGPVQIHTTTPLLEGIQIFNLVGQEVSAQIQILQQNTQSATLDLSKLPTGYYIIKTKTTSNLVYKQ